MKKKKIKVNEQNRVSSPEELDAYIRIAHPGVWLGLAAVVCLLIGVFVWACVGRIEVQVDCISYTTKDSPNDLFVFIHSSEFKNVKTNQTIRLENGQELILTAVADSPIEIRPDEDTVPIEVRSKANWTYGIFGIL